MSGENWEYRNPDAVIDEADKKAQDALKEVGVDAYDLRGELDDRYLAYLQSDEFWKIVDRRLSLADTPITRRKTIEKYVTQAVSEGKYTREQVEEFAQLHEQHYAQ